MTEISSRKKKKKRNRLKTDIMLIFRYVKIPQKGRK